MRYQLKYKFNYVEKNFCLQIPFAYTTLLMNITNDYRLNYYTFEFIEKK